MGSRGVGEHSRLQSPSGSPQRTGATTESAQDPAATSSTIFSSAARQRCRTAPPRSPPFSNNASITQLTVDRCAQTADKASSEVPQPTPSNAFPGLPNSPKVRSAARELQVARGGVETIPHLAQPLDIMIIEHPPSPTQARGRPRTMDSTRVANSVPPEMIMKGSYVTSDFLALASPSTTARSRTDACNFSTCCDELPVISPLLVGMFSNNVVSSTIAAESASPPKGFDSSAAKSARCQTDAAVTMTPPRRIPCAVAPSSGAGSVKAPKGGVQLHQIYTSTSKTAGGNGSEFVKSTNAPLVHTAFGSTSRSLHLSLRA